MKLLLALGLFAHASLFAAAPVTRPNIVVILADDQGWGDVGYLGNKDARTPNIDAFAKQSVSFDRFYVQPVCAPTRAEFLTGRYHPRSGVHGTSTGAERMNPDERTIADAFRAAGYATGVFGKWHNGSQWPYHPNARGFTEYYGFTSGHWGEYYDAPLEHNGQPVRGHGYIANDFTDHAIAFIEQNRAKPFLCYLAFNTPHSPYCVPPEYWAHFKDASITQRGADGDREALDVTRVVHAMNEALDANVGRLLARLDALKLADDTIVVYFSDNGPASFRWVGGMRGKKGTTDEGGVREPFLIRWGNHFPAGTTIREIAGAIDLLPTLTSLAGVTRVGDRPLDGRDLTPLLRGNHAGWPQRMIFSYQQNRVSARDQNYHFDFQGRLYDLASDPGQTKNIAATQPEVATRFRTAVAAWRRDTLTSLAEDDTRPFPAGYREFPRTWLPARDGVAHGGVKRSANAPNSSYFVNWTSPADRITWDVEIMTTGDYDVTMLYTCRTGDEGAEIELTHGATRSTGRVAPAWDPPLITDQDTIPRPAAESIMKDFHPLSLGSVHFEKGRAPLTLRAINIPGKSVMDLRGITLTLLPEKSSTKKL
jgi:arylsulfatase A-like enzyme